MNLTSLNGFDWIVILILGFSIVRAFLRGFLLEISSIVGIVAGILLASWNYILLANIFSRWMGSEDIARIVAFLVIVIGVMIVCNRIGKLLHMGASTIGLGFFDRLFGAAFGFARGSLICIALVMALVAFGSQPRWITNSQLAPYFLAGAHGVSFVVPHDFGQQVAGDILQLKHKAPVWIKLPW